MSAENEEEAYLYRTGRYLVESYATSRLTLHEQATTIASEKDLQECLASLRWDVPEHGLGLEIGTTSSSSSNGTATDSNRPSDSDALLDHLVKLGRGLTRHTPRYFGFVTGGVLPSAALADWFVSQYDCNVQVHLPRESIATTLENVTVQMLLGLLGLSQKIYTGTFTTGATGSNVLGLACAREAQLKMLNQRKTPSGEGEEEDDEEWSLAEMGFGAEKCRRIKVFVAKPHASISKAAALTGIGRRNVIDVGRKTMASTVPVEEDDEEKEAQARVAGLDFDLARLESELKDAQDMHFGRIVVVGMGEVNTGALSNQIPVISVLCKRYGAWLHIDAAFSAFVALLPRYGWISEHMGLADSITSDGHKALNVPYDCGLFFLKKNLDQQDSRTKQLSLLDTVCGPGKGPGPSYLASSSPSSTAVVSPTSEDAEEMVEKQKLVDTLPSPLFRNIENSRRFRALPVYAVLLDQGVSGIRAMVQRNVDFRRKVEEYLRRPESPYQVLTPRCKFINNGDTSEAWTNDWNTTVVLLRAHPKRCRVEAFKDAKTGHLALCDAIKKTQQMYVSPTVFEGCGGVRIAVSHWATGLQDDDRDFKITKQVLDEVILV